MRANDKRTLYVGGIDENVTPAILQAAFVPFGDIVEVNIPMDTMTGTMRGFGFVEFENAQDAAEAIFNMNNAELFGRVLSVNVAKPLAGADRTKAVWHADADAYFAEDGGEGIDDQDGDNGDNGDNEQTSTKRKAESLETQ